MKKVTLFYTLLTIAVIGVGSYWSYQLFVEPEKTVFLVGESSPGHYQIQDACGVCHQSAFGGGEILQDACSGCHAKELKASHDSHPKSKFTDPRNADRVEELDARYCASCHREHQPEITRHMSVTLADDFCFECHEGIAEERPSHEGMGFDTCASAGCHNYHDNRALYEDFLVAHAGEPFISEQPVIAAMKDYVATITPESKPEQEPKPELVPDYPEQSYQVQEITAQWHSSAHLAEANCSDCHAQGEEGKFDATPDPLVCVNCHEQQSKGFLVGKHGMRLAVKKEAKESFPLNGSLAALADPQQRLLTPMTPGHARLPFKTSAHNEQLTCNSCHSAHDYKLDAQASVESCMGCHDDEHTSAYKASPHYALLLREKAEEIPKGSAVTCATCHMPKVEDEHQDGVFYTQHNQNDNLRPNEKMIRSVCLDCHGLQFALDALASPDLIKSNFKGKPSVSIDSINLATERVKE